jgi:hypothetical protein
VVFTALLALIPPVVASVPVSGGVVTFQLKQSQGDLNFSIFFPDQFFNSTQNVTIGMYDENSVIPAVPVIKGAEREAQFSGPIFDIKAISSVSQKQSILFLPYRSSKSKRGDESYIFRIFYFDSVNNLWTLSEASVDDKISLIVSTNTSHFSLWTVISTKVLENEANGELPTTFDWKLALYIGIACLCLIVTFFIARLMHAKHKHIQNSRYNF